DAPQGAAAPPLAGVGARRGGALRHPGGDTMTIRIYTRTGDQGDTGLFGGQRVRKDHVRVTAYGEVDELNATLGLATTELAADGQHALVARLREVQADLLTIGAD